MLQIWPKTEEAETNRESGIKTKNSVNIPVQIIWLGGLANNVFTINAIVAALQTIYGHEHAHCTVMDIDRSRDSTHANRCAITRKY